MIDVTPFVNPFRKTEAKSGGVIIVEKNGKKYKKLVGSNGK